MKTSGVPPADVPMVISIGPLGARVSAACAGAKVQSENAAAAAVRQDRNMDALQNRGIRWPRSAGIPRQTGSSAALTFGRPADCKARKAGHARLATTAM